MSYWLLALMWAIGLGTFAGAVIGVHMWLQKYDSKRRREEYRGFVKDFLNGYVDDSDFQYLVRERLKEIAIDTSFTKEMAAILTRTDIFMRTIRRHAKDQANAVVEAEKDRLINYVNTGLNKISEREDELAQELREYREEMEWVSQLYVVNEHNQMEINTQLLIPITKMLTDEWGDTYHDLSYIRIEDILKNFEVLSDFLTEYELGLYDNDEQRTIA